MFFPVVLVRIIFKFSLIKVYIQKKPQEVFYKKVVLKNFAKLTGKHLRQSLFFSKVVGLRPATLIKRHSGTGFFLLVLRNV